MFWLSASQCGMVIPQTRTAKLYRESCALLSASQGLLSPLCRTSTSNAEKAELLKSSRTQITPVTVSSFTLPSGKSFRSMMAKTERLRRSYSLVLCYIFCTVHWADLTYISLLIIFCIIEYVTNKKNWTLKLESWMLNSCPLRVYVFVSERRWKLTQ